MKKLVLTISFLCYITVTCGVEVNIHYCMNRLSSVHFFGDKADRCNVCGMDQHEADGCCHDERKVVKLEQDQNKWQGADYSLPVFKEMASALSIYQVAAFAPALQQTDFYHYGPPPLSLQDTYLQVNNFRI